MPGASVGQADQRTNSGMRSMFKRFNQHGPAIRNLFAMNMCHAGVILPRFATGKSIPQTESSASE